VTGHKARLARRPLAAIAAGAARLVLALALLVVAGRPPARSVAFQNAPLAGKHRTEQVEAVARASRDAARLPALRPARSGDPPGARAGGRLWFAGLTVASASVAPAPESGHVDPRTIAARTWTPDAPTRAELMVFLN
jgi:hypothetical protein